MSEASGRFSADTLNRRPRRGQPAGGELPGHRALAAVQDREVDWDAEFEAVIADLTKPVEVSARR